ncbi:unnamed protein product [Rhizophagus irregularis]|nr:unnamed protein product [Rhizophagus irregularis]
MISLFCFLYNTLIICLDKMVLVVHRYIRRYINMSRMLIMLRVSLLLTPTSTKDLILCLVWPKHSSKRGWFLSRYSLAQLLENHLIVNSSRLLRVIRVSLLWGSFVGKRCEYDTFYEVWKKIVGVEWYEWVGQCQKVPSILILDETQTIYEDVNKADESMKGTGTAVEFWGVIKMCLQGSNLSVIMFASYGTGNNSAGLAGSCLYSLYHFGITWGLTEIRFTHEELEAYVKDYCGKNFGDDYIISQFIRYIKYATVGHVGLVCHILQHTKDAMQSGIRNKSLTWKEIYMCLNSEDFSETVDDCRAAPNSDFFPMSK